jgi:hypothetical protein
LRWELRKNAGLGEVSFIPDVIPVISPFLDIGDQAGSIQPVELLAGLLGEILVAYRLKISATIIIAVIHYI